jgi:hypothetical protein
VAKLPEVVAETIVTVSIQVLLISLPKMISCAFAPKITNKIMYNIKKTFRLDILFFIFKVLNEFILLINTKNELIKKILPPF